MYTSNAGSTIENNGYLNHQKMLKLANFSMSNVIDVIIVFGCRVSVSSPCLSPFDINSKRISGCEIYR